MKRFIFCSLFLAGALFAGCIADSAKKGDDGDSGDNTTVNAYLPLPLNGITTVWRMRKTFPASQTSDSTYTETITGPVAWDGNDVYTLSRSSYTADPRKMYQG